MHDAAARILHAGCGSDGISERKACHLLDAAQEGASAEAVVQVGEDVRPDQVGRPVRLQEGLEGQHVVAARP